MKKIIIGGLLGAMATAQCMAVHAEQPYPSRPITLIVPTDPGGGMDVLGRVVARKLTEILGQTVLVQNKVGAAGMIATHYVARAAPDGYTLLEGSIGTFAVAPSLYKSISYDALRDFESISKAAVVSNVLIVNPAVPAQNVREFVDLVKANPGVFNNGLSNFGSASHMASELFTQMTGAKFVNVAYKGGEGAVADVAKGAIQLSFSTVASALPLIKAGRLRPLAVTTPQRVSLLPDIPTMSESVLPGFEASNWYSFEAPANTPKAIVTTLNAALRQALTSPDVVKVLRAQGMEADPSSPEGLQRYVESETAKWARVVKSQHIQVQ
jgi:tripartite-type tricarboxylate transporter receptor subunit TctC